MRVSTLCRSVPLLALALASATKAAHDAIAQPYPAAEDVGNYESGNITTGDDLPASSGYIHYRINGPGQIAVIYTEPNCPRRLGAQQLYVPGNDTDTPPELLTIEYCSARCINLPEGFRGESIELSLAGPIIIGERPDRPYARLYETTDCRGVGKEASIRKGKNWACTDVEDGFWNPAREGGFGSFMVWEGCRYLETEEQKEEKRRNGRLRKERERAKADIEKTRWEAVDKERKIQKEEGKMERKLEKQLQKERLKQWEREQKERKKQDKQDEKQEERKEILHGKDRKAAWDARKAQRKKDMKIQFEEWRQDRLMELKEDGARERAERKAQRQRDKEDRQAELLEMEKQWEQDRRDKVVQDDKEWEEQLANEAIEMARDKEEEEMLEVAEVAADKEKWANKNRKRGVKGVRINIPPSGSSISKSTWKWIGVDGFV
ncbi:hypothetical protein VE04_06983 [Pseudogymnoascus sp. 24MN13]|nr:hypothetical protein VE04_06983 [Pseudogymnoascus sp. 24MN13]